MRLPLSRSAHGAIVICMASPVLGIDLGTTNSVVAVANADRVHVLADEEGRQLTPSVVSFHPSGEVLVGAAAAERKLVDATNTIASIKRLIGRPYRSPEVRRAAERFAFELGQGKKGGVVVRARGEDYSLPEVSAFVLRRLKAIAEKALHAGCSSAVVTVPANFNELQRTATRDAARIAGLNVLRILNEPTAAALAYGYGAHVRKRIAVYDLGGGTFDISILDMSGDVIEVIATAGDSYLGGDDIDNAVADVMAQRFLRQHRLDLRGDAQAYERLRLAGEWLKCELSVESVVNATLEEIAFDSGGRAINYDFELTRDELQQLAFPLIGRTFDICEEALQIAGLRPEQLDGVVLVGGQTRSPQVREMVGEYFGSEPQVSVDPDQVVAQGAALQAMALAGQSATKVRTKSGVPAPVPAPAGRKGVQAPPLQASFFANASEDASELDDEPTRVGPPPKSPSSSTPVGQAAGRARVQAPEPLGRSAEKPPPVPPPPAGVVPPPPAGAPVASGTITPERKRRPGSTTLTGVGQGGRSGSVEAVGPRANHAPSDREDTEVMQLPRSSTPPETELGTLEVDVHSADVANENASPSQDQGAAAAGTTALEPEQAHLGASSVAPDEGDFVDEDELPFALRSPSDEQDDAAIAVDVAISSAPPPSAEGRRPPASPVSARPEDAQAGAVLDMAAAAATGPREPAVPPSMPVAPVRPPLLLDVTPRALAVETAGGFCEQIVQRNSPIPTEQSRVFSTSQDRQVQVSMRVCQGEARRTDDNEVLGALELLGLREAPRGHVRIGVTFVIDADGMLRARAQDRTTGKSQEIRINLVGALEDDEIESMRQRQEAMMGQG